METTTFFHVCIIQAIRIAIQNNPATRETWNLIKSQDCHVFLRLGLSRDDLVSLMVELLFDDHTVRWKRGYASPG